MNFLGQASQYPFGRTLRHLFAWGTKNDSLRLRQALADRYGASINHVALYHSGRSALAEAIKSIAPGSVVIVPGLTCIAVIRAVRAAGCTPLYVDIDPETLQYDYADLEQKLSSSFVKNKEGAIATASQESSELKLSPSKIGRGDSPKNPIDKTSHLCYNGSIVVQNTLGLPLDMRKIEQIAAKYNLAIIEDLAHCAGRFYPDGREVGTVGVATALSFGKGKAVDTVCGGAVVIRTPELAQKLAQPIRRPRLATRLRDRWYPVFAGFARVFWPLGIGKPLLAALVRMRWIERSGDTELNHETRLTHWQAKLALRQLPNLPDTPLREYKLVRDREAVLTKLELAGYLWTDIWYDTPVAPARYAEEADFPTADCPRAVEVAAHIINLPTWFRPERLTKARDIIAKSEIDAHPESKQPPNTESEVEND